MVALRTAQPAGQVHVFFQLSGRRILPIGLSTCLFFGRVDLPGRGVAAFR
jgi:hypothetical protein